MDKSKTNQEDILADFCEAINNLDYANPNSVEIAVKAMFAFLQAAIAKGKFKDEFEYFFTYGIVTTTIATSKKTKISLELQFNLLTREIYVESYIQYPYALKSLKDNFLIDFFSEFDKYDFQYIDNMYTEKRKRHKDNIMRFMANYWVLMSELDYKHGSLGDFRAIWSGNLFVETIFEEACIAIKLFYKFNYHLWKSSKTSPLPDK